MPALHKRTRHDGLTAQEWDTLITKIRAHKQEWQDLSCDKLTDLLKDQFKLKYPSWAVGEAIAVVYP